MKRICCFCETWASGGIESFLTKMFAQMDLSGLQIDLVAAQVEDSVFTKVLTAAGVRIIPLPGSKFNWLANTRRFHRLLTENHYDVVHLNAFQGLQLYYLHLAGRAKVPVRIAHSHNAELRKSPLRPLKWLLHRTGRGIFGRAATHRWACSRLAADFLFGQNAPFQFVPNGIETKRFQFDRTARDALRADLGLTDCFVIGNVGRLSDQKNQNFLLDVLVKALKHRPSCRLLLVGEGEREADLKAKAEKLGVTEQVIFYGVTDRVERLLWAMDAFTLPSLFEGLGIVAVEAQASGLPTFCSDTVPEEARLTPLFRSLPLNPDVWAKVLTEIAPLPRDGFAAAVEQKGFESHFVADRIRAAYLDKNSKEM